MNNHNSWYGSKNKRAHHDRWSDADGAKRQKFDQNNYEFYQPPNVYPYRPPNFNGAPPYTNWGRRPPYPEQLVSHHRPMPRFHGAYGSPSYYKFGHNQTNGSNPKKSTGSSNKQSSKFSKSATTSGSVNSMENRQYTHKEDSQDDANPRKEPTKSQALNSATKPSESSEEKATDAKPSESPKAKPSENKPEEVNGGKETEQKRSGSIIGKQLEFIRSQQNKIRNSKTFSPPEVSQSVVPKDGNQPSQTESEAKGDGVTLSNNQPETEFLENNVPEGMTRESAPTNESGSDSIKQCESSETDAATSLPESKLGEEKTEKLDSLDSHKGVDESVSQGKESGINEGSTDTGNVDGKSREEAEPNVTIGLLNQDDTAQNLVGNFDQTLPAQSADKIDTGKLSSPISSDITQFSLCNPQTEEQCVADCSVEMDDCETMDISSIVDNKLVNVKEQDVSEIMKMTIAKIVKVELTKHTTNNDHKEVENEKVNYLVSRMTKIQHQLTQLMKMKIKFAKPSVTDQGTQMSPTSEETPEKMDVDKQENIIAAPQVTCPTPDETPPQNSPAPSTPTPNNIIVSPPTNNIIVTLPTQTLSNNTSVTPQAQPLLPNNTSVAPPANDIRVTSPTQPLANNTSVAPPTQTLPNNNNVVPPTQPPVKHTSVAPPTQPSANNTSVAPPTQPLPNNTSVAPPTQPLANNTSVAPPTQPSANNTSVAPPTQPLPNDTTVAPPTQPLPNNNSVAPLANKISVALLSNNNNVVPPTQPLPNNNNVAPATQPPANNTSVALSTQPLSNWQNRVSVVPLLTHTSAPNTATSNNATASTASASPKANLTSKETGSNIIHECIDLTLDDETTAGPSKHLTGIPLSPDVLANIKAATEPQTRPTPRVHMDVNDPGIKYIRRICDDVSRINVDITNDSDIRTILFRANDCLKSLRVKMLTTDGHLRSILEDEDKRLIHAFAMAKRSNNKRNAALMQTAPPVSQVPQSTQQAIHRYSNPSQDRPVPQSVPNSQPPPLHQAPLQVLQKTMTPMQVMRPQLGLPAATQVPNNNPPGVNTSSVVNNPPQSLINSRAYDLKHLSQETIQQLQRTGGHVITLNGTTTLPPGLQSKFPVGTKIVPLNPATILSNSCVTDTQTRVICLPPTTVHSRPTPGHPVPTSTAEGQRAVSLHPAVIPNSVGPGPQPQVPPSSAPLNFQTIATAQPQRPKQLIHHFPTPDSSTQTSKPSKPSGPPALYNNNIQPHASFPTLKMNSPQTQAPNITQQSASKSGPVTQATTNTTAPSTGANSAPQPHRSVPNQTPLSTTRPIAPKLKSPNSKSPNDKSKNPKPNVKHPAALPPTPYPNSSMPPELHLLLPPRPFLKISKNDTGLVLHWNMRIPANTAEIVRYQLFAYQETPTTVRATTNWKKIDDVKALPLPMACTLTKFQPGCKYYFAVRAVDIFGRISAFSEPASAGK